MAIETEVVSASSDVGTVFVEGASPGFVWSKWKPVAALSIALGCCEAAWPV